MVDNRKGSATLNTMKEDTKQKIEEIERKQRELANELEQLRKEAEKPDVWEPKGGELYIDQDGDVCGHFTSNPNRRKFGVEFESYEESKHAAKIYRFYHRLCKLAEELNPSGKIGGRFYIIMRTEDDLFDVGSASMPIAIDSLFETRQSAQEACEILNRDNWQLPF